MIHTNFKSKKLVFGILALLLSSSTAFAACTLVETTISGFGKAAENVKSREVAGISLNCNSVYKIALNAGSHYAEHRRLNNGTGHFINYALWTDAAGTVSWGDNSSYPANPLTYTGNGTDIFHPIYGSTFSSEAAHVGYYTDTVHVTVTYPPYGSNDKLETELLLNLNKTGTCKFETSGLTGFGSRVIGTADLHGVALGVISVTCTSGTSYAVGLNSGNHWNARDSGKRHMAKDGQYIPYILWANAGATLEWGDTGLSAIESTYTETHPAAARTENGTGNSQNFFIWGDAAVRNVEVPSGTYRDTVTITITWP